LNHHDGKRGKSIRTLQTLTQHTADESFSLSSLFSKAKAALFDEFQMVVPTDDAPLMVLEVNSG
jgi:hypothetical protein